MYNFAYAIEDDLDYMQESALEIQMIEHQIQTMMDCYLCQSYMEDGESAEGEGSKSKNVLAAIGQKITSLIQAIKRAIAGFLDSVKQGSSKRASVDDLLNSDTVKHQFEEDIIQMKADIDAERANARKIVRAISSKTGIPATDIANFCDDMEKKVHDNRYKIGKVAKGVVTLGVANKIANQSLEDAEDYKKMVNELEGLKLDRKNNLDYKELNLINKFIINLNSGINKSFRLFNTIAHAASTVKSGGESIKNSSAKRMKRSIKRDIKKFEASSK